MRALLLSSLIVGSLAMPTAAMARPESPAIERDREGPFKALGLSAEQKGQIKAIRDRHRAAVQSDWKALEAKHRELGALLRQPGATLEQAKAKQHEIDALKAKLAQNRIEAWFESRAVLTPEQIKKLEQLKPPARRGQDAW